MSNCIVAQSGGPSPVINATLAGIIKENQKQHRYDHVYGGLYGIEGVLQEQFVDLTAMSDEENQKLRQTPSCALGTGRYKLKRDNSADFQRMMEIMEKYDVETFFYIGGNDSMDAVAALHTYAQKKGKTQLQFIGCPKTIDNDLMMVDHAPGFGSSAKFIANTTLQCWYDLYSYPAARKEVLIVETMGRDEGWLASTACLSGKVDLLIVPEIPFDKEVFLRRVQEVMDAKSKCVIVVSEGARYVDGTYVSAAENWNELYANAVLGGAGRALEQMIVEAGISPRCRVQELSLAQRCHATELSLVDVEESYQLGAYALQCASLSDVSGKMVGLKRKDRAQYEVEYTMVDANQVASFVQNFPTDWLLDEYRGITEEAYRYLTPLIAGTPVLIEEENGMPAYVAPYYLAK